MEIVPISQVRTRENTFKALQINFPKRPPFEEPEKFVHVNLSLAVGQVKRLQIDHVQKCTHVECSDLQDTVAMHNEKLVIEIGK